MLTLGIGPWLGLSSGSFGGSPAVAYAAVSRGEPVSGQVTGPPPPPSAPARRLSAATGCTCREVVVDASNVVRDAEIRTGDAKVVNKTITYIAPSYGDTDVDIEQDAEAFSGDAIAGQILAVDGGEGCSRVTVTAKNVVEDVELRTGDAVARNRSIVLIDPSIQREDLEIEVDQEATARSGDAIAGQVIGVQGGGPCGGVIVDALNRVRDAELRTGEAITENISDILTCDDEGCIDDLTELLGKVDAVDVCTDEGCEPVPVKEFIKQMQEQADAPAPAAADDEDADEPRRTDEPDDDDEPRATREPSTRDSDGGSRRSDVETPEPASTPETTPF